MEAANLSGIFLITKASLHKFNSGQFTFIGAINIKVNNRNMIKKYSENNLITIAYIAIRDYEKFTDFSTLDLHEGDSYIKSLFYQEKF